MKKGKLYLVSVGPGSAELIPPMAEAALRASDLVVGYDLYLKWIAPWIKDKEIKTLPLTQEKERAGLAIAGAREGRNVSLVSSGDIGVYAMAGLVFELMDEKDTFECEVIPGISAAQSCGALLGAPLTHDYATLSLSDLLCPWEWIEERAGHLAAADMVVALYNVQSKGRPDGIYRILHHFLKFKSKEVLCGVVRNAFREEQEAMICSLGDLLERKFDMLTTIIIGNRFTKRKRQFLYTPRGYVGWKESQTAGSRNETFGEAVWVFSGTSDGNELARELLENSHQVVVSTASEYGQAAATEANADIPVRSGRIGKEARKEELKNAKARMIVDATHPFADKISNQLIELADELDIPYLRYERQQIPLPDGTIVCDSMKMASSEAIHRGRNIFLATGSKDLETFLGAAGAEARSWFIRIVPDEESLQRVLRLGISRARICCMQGPFSKEFNEAQWRDWNIDCVVTKESGEAGGFTAKIDAAQALKIPLIVVTRPSIVYPRCVHDTASVIRICNEELKTPAKQNQLQPLLNTL